LGALKPRLTAMYDLRRNDFDVANSVQVSSTAAVAAAVRELFTAAWPSESFDKVAVAFEDFDKLFTGRMPGYHGVDTLYHDRQHSLDMTLAMARLLEFTLYHVTRSARFLARYLPSIGLESWVPVATRIVHFTGYEIKLNMIQLADPKDRKLGHLLGTADLIAQMADRCYLEKCRDRLYPEFVLGGVAATTAVDGSLRVRYSSGLDLLRQTPEFVRETFVGRLEGEFEHAYRYLECLFDGKNPYLEAIERNVGYLHRVLRTERWPMLRRNPPLFTSDDTQIGQVRGLMLDRLKALWA